MTSIRFTQPTILVVVTLDQNFLIWKFENRAIENLITKTLRDNRLLYLSSVYQTYFKSPPNISE